MRPVSLFCLSYRVNGCPRVVIQSATSISHARLKAAMADLADDQNFATGMSWTPRLQARFPRKRSADASRKAKRELLDHLAA